MSVPAPPISSDQQLVRLARRIEFHLERLAVGHDPFGHLFAIERLARAARAEWSEGQRQFERERRQ